MGQVPTREQLYEEVDRLFRQEFPDAPAVLSRGPADEWYRDAWLGIRDNVLNTLTDEIFFDGAPGAPYPLDPDNDAHDTYVKEWIEIRNMVLDNAPMLPIGDIDDDKHFVDMYYVRAGIEDSLQDVLAEAPESIHAEIRTHGATADAKVYDAFLVGDISTGATWWSEPIVWNFPEGTWRLYIAAWWEESNDQSLHARLALYHE
jgi:hypothetical protein